MSWTCPPDRHLVPFFGGLILKGSPCYCGEFLAPYSVKQNEVSKTYMFVKEEPHDRKA